MKAVKFIKMGQYKGFDILYPRIHIDKNDIKNELMVLRQEMDETLEQNSDKPPERLLDQIDEMLMRHLKASNHKELMERIQQALFDKRSHDARISHINTVMRKVLDLVDIDYEKRSIDKAVQLMYYDLKQKVKQKNRPFESYLKYNGFQTAGDLKQHLESEVKTTYLEYAVLDKIAEKENITISEDEFEFAQKDFITGQADGDILVKDIREFKQGLLYTKVVDYLVRVNTAKD